MRVSVGPTPKGDLSGVDMTLSKRLWGAMTASAALALFAAASQADPVPYAQMNAGVAGAASVRPLVRVERAAWKPPEDNWKSTFAVYSVRPTEAGQSRLVAVYDLIHGEGDRGGKKPYAEPRKWADSRTCPQLRAMMDAYDALGPAAFEKRPGLPPPFLDGWWSFKMDRGDSLPAYETTELDPPLLWADEFLPKLKPCWTRSPPRG